MVVDWIWRLLNIALESGVLPEDWRSVVIVPLYGRGLIVRIIEEVGC